MAAKSSSCYFTDMRKNTIALITAILTLYFPLGCNAVPVPPVEEPEQEPGQEQEKPEESDEPEEPKDPVLTLEWVGYMDGYNTISAPAIADDGSVYATTDKDQLYKFSATGENLWQQQIVADPSNKNKVYATPTVDEDGVVYIATGSSTGLACCVAFNPDGSRKWTFTDFWNTNRKARRNHSRSRNRSSSTLPSSYRKFS